MNQQRSFWTLGLRARVILPLVLIGLLAVSAGAFIIYRTSERSAHDQILRRAEAINHAICHLAENTAEANSLQRFVVAMASEKDVKLIVVAAGEPLKVVASSKPEWLGLLTTALPDKAHTHADLERAVQFKRNHLEFDHDAEGSVDFTIPLRTRLQASSPLRWANGAVMLHLDGRPLMREQAEIREQVLSTLVLIVVIAALGVYALFRFFVLAPIDRIARTARAVANGERTARVASTQDDELGELAANFDAMLDHLIQSEKREELAKQAALSKQKQLESTLGELSSSNFALDQHAIVAVTDLAGTIIYTNDKFCEISQYSREELLGSNHRLVNSGYHPKSFWVEMWRTVVRGSVWQAEVCNRAKSGTLYWVDTTIVPYTDLHGKVNRLVAIRTDITARKNAEAELKSSRERYELAVNGSSDGLWDWNIASGTIYYSARFKSMLGYNDEEFPNDTNSFKRRLHPDERTWIHQAIRKHLNENEPFDVSCRLRTKSNEYRWFRIKGAAIRDQKGIANRMAGSISDISDIKTAQEQLARNGLIDSLTGLANRTLLLQRLQSAIDKCQHANHPYAVLFLDFDRFKLINDSLGHEAGDELLRQIAGRLRAHLQSMDSINHLVDGNTCSRIGGDEFVVLVQHLTGIHEALAIAEDLCLTLMAPYHLDGREVYSSASIGIVVGSAQYVQAADVVRDADTAMYEAKRMGKARFVLFDEKMRENVIRRQQLESDLHRAIEACELELEYQPITDLRSNSVHSLEVLCRWKNSTLGSISPAEFIPIAEETGLINDLFAWVLRTVCRQLALWKIELGDAAPRALSVNVSRKQLGFQNLCQLVRDTLAEFEIEASSIELEVTEDAFCEDMPKAVATLKELKDIGVRIAVDDFGIGSSSFASLHRFPIDSIKIDRSLTNDLAHSQEAKALLEGLVVISGGLGISLVAEGVETSEQLKVLKELGCDLAQGYYFSRPLPLLRIENFLRDQLDERTVKETSS
jgi:diguanylate cyclase (GGDEF)-like protein/PAS domain S-box-containing protein